MVTISEAELKDWEGRIGTSPSQSADFAQIVWDGRVSPEQQLRLLQSESSQVRSSISWAIFDRLILGEPLDYLVQVAIDDPSSSVRGYALLAIKQLKIVDVHAEKLRSMLDHDPDHNIRKMVRDLLDLSD